MIHARTDYQRIQDPEGRIPADEPVFLIRGQDAAAPQAVGYWASVAEAAGASREIVAAAREQALRMIRWQRTHGCKTPDMPADATPAPAPTAPAQTCETCGGTGWQDLAMATGVKGTRQQCQRCGGSGRVTQPAPDEGAVEALVETMLAGLPTPPDPRFPVDGATMLHLMRVDIEAMARAAIAWAERAYGGEVAALRRALELAAVRLEILTGRMRACHQETGKHELLGEAEVFCREAREDLALAPSQAAQAVQRLVEAALRIGLPPQREEHDPGCGCSACEFRKALAPFLTARGGGQGA